MKVIVEIITGTFIDTEVSENATVKELKEKLAAEVKLPVKRLILVVGDEETRRVVMETEEDVMLRDLDVGEYSHMYLFFKHPDLVSSEERSRGEEGDDDPMEEISSKPKEEEEEEKAKIDGEDSAMKNEEEEEDREEKVEDEGEEDEKEKNGEEEKDKDDVKEEAREGEECEDKEET